MINMIKNKIPAAMKTSALSICAIALLASPSFASDKSEGQAVDILPKTTAAPDGSGIEMTTHELIRLTPDKSELIHLDDEAASIIVGNPAHVNVIADTSTTLVLVPRVPGATHFTVLGKKGQVIMQRHVIVASPKEDYVRVKRVCRDDSGDGCANTSVFYCPDMCHEIGIVSAEQAEKQDKSGNSNNDKNADDSEDNGGTPEGDE